MGKSFAGHLPREPQRHAAAKAAGFAPRRTLLAERDWVLSVQRNVSNRAVSRLFSAENSSPAETFPVRSPGQPLGPDMRGLMGARLGHDFSAVRVHTDPEAAEAARHLNATAFTVDQHVVLGDDAPSLQSKDGRRLLAHELAAGCRRSRPRWKPREPRRQW
jgi:hypothetical protein